MKLLVPLALLISVAYGRPYKLAGIVYHFAEKDGLQVYGCDKSCDALKIIERHQSIQLKEVRKGLKQANSIGSDVCSHVYRGKSVLGVNENRDGRAFCLFKDKSLVELNSLEAYLIEKKYLK